jgi:hypothetical protein
MMSLRSIGMRTRIRPSSAVTSCSAAVKSFQFRSKGTAAYEESLKHPETFWGRASEDITWFEKHNQVLDRSNAPFYKWFVGGKMNTCYNCVDRHVEDGNGDRLALIYDSPVTNTIRKYTYSQLQAKVVKLSYILQQQGVVKGDRVVIYLPNISEAAIVMLACARLDAIHSVVFGGFAAPELATRIRDCKPKTIISTSVGVDGSKIIQYKPLLGAAIKLCAGDYKVPSIRFHTIILQRLNVTEPCKMIMFGDSVDHRRGLFPINGNELVVPPTDIDEWCESFQSRPDSNDYNIIKITNIKTT